MNTSLLIICIDGPKFFHRVTLAGRWSTPSPNEAFSQISYICPCPLVSLLCQWARSVIDSANDMSMCIRFPLQQTESSERFSFFWTDRFYATHLPNREAGERNEKINSEASEETVLLQTTDNTCYCVWSVVFVMLWCHLWLVFQDRFHMNCI